MFVNLLRLSVGAGIGLILVAFVCDEAMLAIVGAVVLGAITIHFSKNK